MRNLESGSTTGKERKEGNASVQKVRRKRRKENGNPLIDETLPPE